MLEEKKYGLALGAQVREENFGLLFYTMRGPRLYFLTCGPLLGSAFFEVKITFGEYLKERRLSADLSFRLGRILYQLREKGVILER
jgi:putative mycofactocin binding protein MftB